MCCPSTISPITDAVALTQSPKGAVCSKQQLVYNCTTGGPALAWIVVDKTYPFDSESQINDKYEAHGFVMKLISIQLPNYFANSMAESVLSSHNGTLIACSNGDKVKSSVVVVGGMIKLEIVYIWCYILQT